MTTYLQSKDVKIDTDIINPITLDRSNLWIPLELDILSKFYISFPLFLLFSFL